MLCIEIGYNQNLTKRYFEVNQPSISSSAFTASLSVAYVFAFAPFAAGDGSPR